MLYPVVSAYSFHRAFGLSAVPVVFTDTILSPYVAHNTSLTQLLVRVKARSSSLKTCSWGRNWDSITAVMGQSRGRVWQYETSCVTCFLTLNHATLLEILCRPCNHSDTTYNTALREITASSERGCHSGKVRVKEAAGPTGIRELHDYV
jgi:hypothetical protein